MNQLDLTYDRKLPESRQFDGKTFEPAKDAERLGKQLAAVRAYMLTASRHNIDGGWRSLHQIQRATCFPESSISARLRDLRKPRFGGYTVERRRVSDSGLHEYRVSR